ncbi:hypothetical protein [Arthrobacter koreensis]|uniref:hypothetical protein n=1 Tax=Arthrobacter koreensis TaxID=199136 RepID=UPI002DBC4FAB|nr:hypothetical protein [Arthrobacter koreensis]MEB7505145.1 hypothetical protein [Arthrobacter koreensis]
MSHTRSVLLGQGAGGGVLAVSALAEHGIVDRIVAEFPDAALEGPAFCRRLAESVEYELSALSGQDAGTRLHSRTEKFRTLGSAL